MADRLTAISSGFTIHRRYAGTDAELSGRFPQSIDVREAKKLRAWLDRFITDAEKDAEKDKNAEG